MIIKTCSDILCDYMYMIMSVAPRVQELSTFTPSVTNIYNTDCVWYLQGYTIECTFLPVLTLPPSLAQA